jgi:hypothetical protein
MVYQPTLPRPTGNGVAVTASGPSHEAYLEWAARMRVNFPDGEWQLVDTHLMEMLGSFSAGKPVMQPSNKYAKLAVEGFLITLQGMKDHGISF